MKENDRCIRCGLTTDAPQDGENCTTCWANSEQRITKLEAELTLLQQELDHLIPRLREFANRLLVIKPVL